VQSGREGDLAGDVSGRLVMIGERELEVRVGTCAWSDPSWSGNFYPTGIPTTEYLRAYSERFDTVEIDSTWYRIPAARTVDGWTARVPPGFVFSAKAPQAITHERVLVDCEAELAAYLSSIERLNERLGTVLFQFPYFRKSQIAGLDAFLERLVPFLALLPEGRRFAVEVRNRSWIAPPLLEALRERNIALALTDHPWMPRPEAYARHSGLVTADFLYVRWLGDRHAIEEQTTRWNRLIVDRTEEMRDWVQLLRDLSRSVRTLYAYFNYHYAGCAYESAALFERMWGIRPAARPRPVPLQPVLNV
jgi:uncharacterized protein YecE (DUF72 family)